VAIHLEQIPDAPLIGADALTLVVTLSEQPS
jgi:hypothetical protein